MDWLAIIIYLTAFLLGAVLSAGCVLLWQDRRREKKNFADYSKSGNECVANLRGDIDACTGAELALAQFAEQEVVAAITLAQYRDRAAHARSHLRQMGIEV